MRNSLILILSIVPIGLLAKPDPHDLSTWVWNDPSPIVGVEHGEIFSQAMERMMGYNVYLPDGYDEVPDARYPVVYWLHGAYGKENDIKLAMVAKSLAEKGEIGETIYVIANSGSFSRYRDWANEKVMAETWFIEELMPEIERRYRVYSERSGRAIAGFSMGGEGALYLGFKYPELFCAIGSISPALQWPSSLGQPALKSDETVFQWAKRNKSQLSDGRIAVFLSIGGEDKLYDDFPHLLDELNQVGIKVRAQVFDGVGHNLDEISSCSGEDLVRYLSRNYSAADMGMRN